MATTSVTITVPDGVGPGEEFAVEWGGLSYNIAVPHGVGPGQELQIDLPALEESLREEAPPAAPGMTSVTIVVPDGLLPGQEFAVEWGGLSYNIAVPDGVLGGQDLQIELPALDESAPSGRSFREEPAPAPVPASSAMEGVFGGGGGAFDLCGLGLDLDAVMQDAIEGEVAVVAEFEAWKPAGEHYIGKAIKVQRSNGDWSDATVVEYDEIMETYTVNVGEPGTTWGIKYGVESGSIAPADHIVAMAGDFTSGLRVTVPHLGSRIKHRPVDRDDVTGEIHGFDINDLTYSVRLEGGKIVRGIKGDQIRPLPRRKAMG